VKKSVCHAERSEASAFISLKTNNCRSFASLRMTGVVDLFTGCRSPFLAHCTSQTFIEFRGPKAHGDRQEREYATRGSRRQRAWSFSSFSFSCRIIWAMSERTYFRRQGLASQRTSTTTSLLTG